MNSEIRILFYSPAAGQFSTLQKIRQTRLQSTAERGLDDDPIMHLNSAPLYLNSFIKMNKPDLFKRISWERCIQRCVTDETLAHIIKSHKINVVCLGMYVWNESVLYSLMKNFKTRFGNDILLLVGGPSVGAKSGEDVLVNYPDVDSAVFAQGESAFCDLLEHHFMNKQLSLLNTTNTIWRANGQVKKALYKNFSTDAYSPFIESRDLIVKIMNDPIHANVIFEFPWETSRGCPYSCTFCDWNSGLTAQTTKRKSFYKEELTMLGELGIKRLMFTDANFGLWPVDVEIAREIVKQAKTYGFKTWVPNTSKTKKDRVFEILDILIEGGVVDMVKFSFQDIHQHILENIDRPDMPWEEHKVLITHLQQKYPNIVYKGEFIRGLPGQTFDTWVYQLSEMYKLGLLIEAAHWIYIPNSPVDLNAEYREKQKLKFKPVSLTGVKIVSESYSFKQMDLAHICFAVACYRMLHFLGVTQQELESFYNEQRHMTGVVKECCLLIDHLVFKIGMIPSHELVLIYKKIFSKNYLIIKYQDKWLEFLEDPNVVHKNNTSPGI